MLAGQKKVMNNNIHTLNRHGIPDQRNEIGHDPSQLKWFVPHLKLACIALREGGFEGDWESDTCTQWS